ncbi:MAG TPA: dihydrolipoamide acetyltransferase family protein [Candidatus Dormibacteraeota bacterium]|nr:dihydrolipoamide acetyltransferase family protein [Candidatus Dormibacteraeota bacterium]
MPDLGEGLTEGEILRWLVATGDVVTVDQPVVEMSTEKATVQVPTPFAGTVVRLHGAKGDIVHVGSPLITIEVATAAESSGNVLVGYGTSEVPARRRRVVLQPPGAVAPRRPVAPEATSANRIALRGIRRTTAERLSQSHRDAPAALAWVTVDASRLLAWRDQLTERHPDVRITPLALLLTLCAAAFEEFPLLNAAFDAERQEIITHDTVNLGVAMQVEQGLLVPVVRDAQRLSAVAIAKELTRLMEAARSGTIDAAEMRGSTFTVSNYGSFGVDGGVAIINPPEAGILGVGRISERPWVVEGAVVPRPLLELSLAFDHRVCDGGDAGGFLHRLAEDIEHADPTATDG